MENLNQILKHGTSLNDTPGQKNYDEPGYKEPTREERLTWLGVTDINHKQHRTHPLKENCQSDELFQSEPQAKAGPLHRPVDTQPASPDLRQTHNAPGPAAPAAASPRPPASYCSPGSGPRVPFFGPVGQFHPASGEPHEWPRFGNQGDQGSADNGSGFSLPWKPVLMLWFNWIGLSNLSRRSTVCIMNDLPNTNACGR